MPSRPLGGLGSFLLVAGGLFVVLRVLHVGVPLLFPGTRPGPFAVASLDEAQQGLGFPPLVPPYPPPPRLPPGAPRRGPPVPDRAARPVPDVPRRLAGGALAVAHPAPRGAEAGASSHEPGARRRGRLALVAGRPDEPPGPAAGGGRGRGGGGR